MLLADTPEQKADMESDPKAWLEYRKGIEFEVSSRYKFVRRPPLSSHTGNC